MKLSHLISSSNFVFDAKQSKQKMKTKSKKQILTGKKQPKNYTCTLVIPLMSWSHADIGDNREIHSYSEADQPTQANCLPCDAASNTQQSA